MNSTRSVSVGTDSSCPICRQGDRVNPCYNKRGYIINRCSRCDLMFVYPRPSKSEIHGIYSRDYFKRGNKYSPDEPAFGSSPNLVNDQEKLRTVRKYSNEGRLLDLGCALGDFLRLARDQDFSVKGVEVSEWAAAHARSVHGLDVTAGELQSAGFEPGSFDVITMWDVIEHLDDPNPVLSEAFRLLKPGGVLILSTGDAGSRWARFTGRYWQLLTPPQHLYFHSRMSISKVLAGTGFRVEEIFYLGKSARLDFISFKACEMLGLVMTPIDYIIRNTPLGKLIVRINLGDIMTCVARKLNLNEPAI